MTPIDFNGLDSTVHGPVRLGVLTALHMDGPFDYTSLKTRLNVHDGIIAMHLRKLEDARYILCAKKFVGRRPKSTYRITPKGRQALENYLGSLRQLLDEVQGKKPT